MLTDSAIDSVSSALFDKPNPWVAEAYSAYDAEPLLFASSDEVAKYIRGVLALPRGLAFLFVVYPDMKGRAVREVIRLDPKQVPGHKLRYTWQGFGLISVQLAHAGIRSRIAANSQARAEKWAPTYPLWDGPDAWDLTCG